MSKPSEKYRPFDKKIKQSAHGDTSHEGATFKIFFFITLILILAGIPFVLGKQYEFNTPDPFDSGSNVYSAQHILSGAKIGVDELPSADLGTLLVNILGVKLFGFNEFGPKLIQGILQAAALILMLVVMRKIFGILAAGVGTVVASVYLSYPLISKFGNVKEEFMIACMVIGVSCFILYQFNGKKLLAFLTGVFLIWAPLFKATGMSAIGGLGVFILAQPFLKNRTWKQTAIDVGLVAAGAVAAMAPIYIWMIGWKIKLALPYSFLWTTVAGMLPVAKSAGAAKANTYISQAQKIMPFSELWPRVLRFCIALIVPVGLAIGSVIVGLVHLIKTVSAARQNKPQPRIYDRFVFLLAPWWLLDMAFLWISPRSYEQYYLPLTASGAYLGGYIIAVYSDIFAATAFKARWFWLGAAVFACIIAGSWRVFFGIETSPWSGLDYGEKKHGYAQTMEELAMRRKLGGEIAYWEPLGDYIREHSTPKDKIYVWGWYPGIYVQAQRLSSSPKAFESEMHIRSPQDLAETIKNVVTALKKEEPKFIVDSKKRHLPLDRIPFELWPVMPEGFMGNKKPAFLPNDKNVIRLYDEWWMGFLRKQFGEDEAQRYEAMGPLREFVMTNYHFVRLFGDHVLFELNKPEENKEQK